MGTIGETGLMHPDQKGIDGLIKAARDMAPISGLTHNFYRYPARFSPSFVGAAIHALSEPGDWVMDPFAGGGTTLVESLAAGRNALGIDISALAVFVCKAKTILLDDRDVEALRHWARQLRKTINMHAPGYHFSNYADAGYYRNISGREYWRLRKAIEQALCSITCLRSDTAQTFARCVILKTAQWALDARKTLPSVPRFREELAAQAEGMILSALNFRARVEQSCNGRPPEMICLNRPTAGLDLDPGVAHAVPPKLIITSPPYPGIHVLYHRWQVDGGKEAPAPFWIANKLDGAGSSHYTMGDRRFPELRTYFESLEASFQSIANVCGPETTVVQMVAFSDPTWQLPRYLEVMEDAGLTEAFLPALADDRDGRLWRSVPNRRWYADQRGETPGSQEVVLIHRLSAAAATRLAQQDRSNRSLRPQDRPGFGSSVSGFGSSV
jgi:hypothetical protein